MYVQYLARLRMDLDIANRRLETSDDEKRKLIQERDEVAIVTRSGLNDYGLELQCFLILSSV